MAERELSPSQKAAIYIELGMLEEDQKGTAGQGSRTDKELRDDVVTKSKRKSYQEAARKAGVGEHTMRDTEWLFENAPDEYEAARAHPPIWPTKPSAER